MILAPAYRLLRYDSLASTNDEAKRLARDGAEEGTIVWAREQTVGRGRRGRPWQSPPGNLYATFLRRPRCAANVAHQLGFAAALAVADTCAALLPAARLLCKWPNDVLVNGRKVSGILLESESDGGASLAWLVVGIGLNVVASPVGTEYPATSLHEEGAAGATAETALEHLASAFLAWSDRWIADGFAPIRAAWLGRAANLDEDIRVRLPRETLTGRFVDLDAEGALLLETQEGRRRIAAGDVFPAAA
jgi:BirA family transcriptional regulator, biotin operon repressor / biotin---[acetyl-CoA-carboxylase] ligase